MSEDLRTTEIKHGSCNPTLLLLTCPEECDFFALKLLNRRYVYSTGFWLERVYVVHRLCRP